MSAKYRTVAEARFAYEQARLNEEAYLMAWGTRFNVETCRRYLRITEELNATRDPTPREIEEQVITARACVIADTITDEELIAAGFPPRRVAEQAA